MNMDLIVLRAALIGHAVVEKNLAKELHSDYHSARADAFCTAIIELDRILIWKEEHHGNP